MNKLTWRWPLRPGSVWYTVDWMKNFHIKTEQFKAANHNFRWSKSVEEKMNTGKQICLVKLLSSLEFHSFTHLPVLMQKHRVKFQTSGQRVLQQNNKMCCLTCMSFYALLKWAVCRCVIWRRFALTRLMLREERCHIARKCIYLFVWQGRA